MCNSLQNPHPCPDQLLGASGVAVRGHCLPSFSEAGVGRRGRLWAICAVVDIEAQEGDGPLVQSLQRTLESRGSASSRPAAWERAAGVVLENPLFSTAPPQLRPPSLLESSSSSSASISPPASVRVCVLGRGGSAAGFPTGKQPSPSPELFETLNRNRRQDAPGREAAPARISLPGGAAMTHPPPSSPRFPCLHFSSRPRGGRCRHSRPVPRHRGRGGPGTQAGAAPAPLGFLGSQAGPRPTTPESGLHPRPMPAPFPTPSPTVRPGASSPPSQAVPGRGRGRGAQGGVTAPARTSASCSLASVPGASWLICLGRRWRFGAPCRRGGSPPRPLPSTHLKGASPPRPLPWRRVQLGITLVTSPGASSPRPSRSIRGLAEGLPPPQPFARARRAVRA